MIGDSRSRCKRNRRDTFDPAYSRGMRTRRLVVALTALVMTSAAPAWAEPPAVAKSGIAYKPDSDHGGPKDLVDAVRAPGTGGKLLNLDRMFFNSPPFAKGWNTMFAAIRGQLGLPAKLREICIMA